MLQPGRSVALPKETESIIRSFTPKMAINAAAPLIPDKSAMKTAMREELSEYSTQR